MEENKFSRHLEKPFFTSDDGAIEYVGNVVGKCIICDEDVQDYDAVVFRGLNDENLLLGHIKCLGEKLKYLNSFKLDVKGKNKDEVVVIPCEEKK